MSDTIIISGSVIPSQTDTLLDKRTKVATFADIANIENPARFLVITVEDTGRKYEVKKLTSKVIGGVTVPNAAIDINDPDALEDLGKGEEERVEAEKSRQVNEDARVEAENERNEAEEVRSANESQRISGEAARKSNESARQTDEAARVSAESARVVAESNRETAFNTMMAASETATTNANAAAASANKVVDEYETVVAEQDAKLTELGSNVGTLKGNVTKLQSNIDGLGVKNSVDTDNGLYITDTDGNVLAKFDSNGLSIIDVRVKENDGFSSLVAALISLRNKVDKDGTKVLSDENFTSDNKAVVDKFLDAYNDVLYVCDGQGNVVFKLDKDGIHAVGLDKPLTWLTGKNIYSLGDSLGTSGVWQSKIAGLTGANFDKSLNYSSGSIDNLSEGGTATYGGVLCARDRAHNLIKLAQAGHKIDVVFLENVNDVNKVGDEDIPIEGLPLDFGGILIYEGSFQSSYEDAKAYFMNNIATILNDVTPQIGYTVKMPYSSSNAGVNVKVTNLPTNSGNITLNVGGNAYGIALSSEMTIDNVLEKILEWDYADYSDTKGDDNVSVDFVVTDGSAPASVSFVDTDNTGLQLSITSKSDTVNYVSLTFNNLDISTFTNGDSWGESWAVESLARVYKGMIECLQKNLPDTLLVGVIPTYCTLNYTTVKRVDGSIDFETAYNSSLQIKFRRLVKFQKEIYKMYGIPVIDLTEESGITFTNAYPKYYPNSNVHPTTEGYIRWGETISRVLTSK